VLRLDLEFDGTDFEGWQRQDAERRTARTVQGVLEEALTRALGAPHVSVASGRIDSGAHARHLVVSVRTRSALPAARVRSALDALLPQDVGVLEVRDAAVHFHARRDASWKWYRYRILVTPTRRPLRRVTTWHRRAVPPIGALEAAAGALAGRHDFASFANAGASPGSTVRTLHRLRAHSAGDEVHVDAVGDGFLYRMVRTLVGSLLQAGRTSDPAHAASRMLAARDRRAAGPAAPACGLTLMAVATRGEPLPPWVPLDLLPPVDLAPAGAPAREPTGDAP